MKLEVIVYPKDGGLPINIQPKIATSFTWTCDLCNKTFEIREGHERDDAMDLGAHQHTELQ